MLVPASLTSIPVKVGIGELDTRCHTCLWAIGSSRLANLPTAFAKMVNRGDALESDEWRHEPYEKQWAWLIPIEVRATVKATRTFFD